ncbi:MAG: SCO6745 family protein [Ilumatobacteraceae bacterium]
MTDWQALSARASFASHRLIGWTFWDPGGIDRYAALGVPNGQGYYIATRAAPLAPAGDRAVIAAFGSIHPDFIRFSLGLARQHTTFDDAYRVRNEAVTEGLDAYVPGLAPLLAGLAAPLWDATDSLPLVGRVLFGAHADAPRWEHEPAVSAWLAVNCIREWRGDTHWAVLADHDLSGVEAGLLHDAWMGYPGEWIPRSRGADDHGVATAFERLAARGLASQRADGSWGVDEAGIALRDSIEAHTDRLCEAAWRHLGEERTVAFCETVEPHGPTLMARIDATAGLNWMPAARERRR